MATEQETATQEQSDQAADTTTSDKSTDKSAGDPASKEQSPNGQDGSGEKLRLDRDDEDHDFVDQSKIDFDPDDGLYSGTSVTGDTKIPGPHLDHETGELTGMDEAEQPSSADEAARQQAPQAGDEGKSDDKQHAESANQDDAKQDDAKDDA